MHYTWLFNKHQVLHFFFIYFFFFDIEFIQILILGIFKYT